MCGATTVTGIGTMAMGLVVGERLGSTLNSEWEVGIYSQAGGKGGGQWMENY